jgi:hypothetical protein
MRNGQQAMRSCARLLGAIVVLASSGHAGAAGFVGPQDLIGNNMAPTHVAPPRHAAVKAPARTPSQHLHVELAGTRALAVLGPVNELLLRAEDQETIDRGVGRLRNGVVRDLDAPLLSGTEGWTTLGGGGRIWSAAIVAQDARELRVHFTGVDLPYGAEIWVYGDAGEEPIGPYTDAGPRDLVDFWSPPVLGDTIYVEYYLPAGAVDPGFEIDAITHIYRDPFDPTAGDDPYPPRDCHLDIMCYPAWHPLHEATVKIEFVDGGQGFLCSATLLTTQAADETPYVMTAEHCIGSQPVADTVTFRWFYQTASCNGFGQTYKTAYDATLLKRSGTYDYSLIMAEGELPEGVTWAGWDANVVPNGTDVVGIHHPGGDRKKYSKGDKISHPWGDSTHFHGVTWSEGTIEGGSSGSGLYNDSNQLYVGICSHSALPQGCSNPEGPSGYGRFDRVYPYITEELVRGTDDAFDAPGSDNDTCAAASDVYAIDYDQLVVKSTDEDWYRMLVLPDEEITIDLLFVDRWGDIDIKVYDACGGAVVAAGDSSDDDEQVSFINQTGGPLFYYVHVYLASDTRNQYDMSITTSNFVPDITHELVEVPITPEAIADDPALAGAQTFDLQVTLSNGNDWTAAEVIATVDGTFYQHPIADDDVPQTAFWPAFPSLEYDSFFTSRDFVAPGFADGPFNSDDEIRASWFDTVDTGNGTYTIARFTVTSGTTLTVTGNTTAKYTGGELQPYSFTQPLDIGEPCEGDLNGDGVRDLSDLGVLLASFEVDDGGDIDGDGDTDLSDLGAFLGVFEVPCP